MAVFGHSVFPVPEHRGFDFEHAGAEHSAERFSCVHQCGTERDALLVFDERFIRKHPAGNRSCWGVGYGDRYAIRDDDLFGHGYRRWRKQQFICDGDSARRNRLLGNQWKSLGNDLQSGERIDRGFAGARCCCKYVECCRRSHAGLRQ